jgi:hypothetical protein
VLPAMLYVLHPPGEQEALGIAALAPVDDFLERHRIPIIAATLGVAESVLFASSAGDGLTV